MLKSKKIIGTLLALCLITSCYVIPAAAVDADSRVRTVTLQPIDADGLVEVTGTTSATRIYSNLSFSSLAKSNYVKFSDTYNIKSGTDILSINSFTWTPTGQKLSVIFINVQTNKWYAAEFSGGYVNSTTLSTSSVPSGEYYIGVCNYNGPSAVTGALSFGF